jgi:hypothetical protein
MTDGSVALKGPVGRRTSLLRALLAKLDARDVGPALAGRDALVAQGTGETISDLLTHYHKSDLLDIGGRLLTWAVGGRYLTINSLVSGFVEVAFVLAVALLHPETSAAEHLSALVGRAFRQTLLLRPVFRRARAAVRCPPAEQSHR